MSFPLRFAIVLSLAVSTFFCGKSTFCSTLSAQSVPAGTADASQADALPENADDADPSVEPPGVNPTGVAVRRSGADHFMRIRKDRDGQPVSLDTSITRYQLTDDQGKMVHVDLIGAVHIGEKEYYQQLNKTFEKYDAMLYELVAPEGTVIPKGGRNAGAGGITNPVAAIQKGMQSLTKLEFQLNHIDYTQPNFVHADMTPEEFSQSMEDNGESVVGYVFKAIGQAMAMQQGGAKDPSLSIAMALFSKNRVLRVRRSLAQQIHNMESGMIVFEGKNGSTIIDHRNAKCMQILRREIANGNTNIGIFYGAGHLMDMEKRLLSDFKAKRAGQHWLAAWKLAKTKQEK
jgi:hypothetical protein